jgi:hypothetical protein
MVDVVARETHVMTAPGAEGYARTQLVAFADPLPVPETAATITLA